MTINVKLGIMAIVSLFVLSSCVSTKVSVTKDGNLSFVMRHYHLIYMGRSVAIEQIGGAAIGEITPAKMLSRPSILEAQPTSALAPDTEGSIDWTNPKRIKVKLFKAGDESSDPLGINGSHRLHYH